MSTQEPTMERAPYGVREFDLSESRNLRRVDIKADNFAVLRADDSVDIRINYPDAAAIPARDISGITISGGESGEPGISRLYISNNAGSGVLRLLTGFGVTSGSTDTPKGDSLDIQDRSAREMGKVRLEESGGTLIDPATNGVSAPDRRDITAVSGASTDTATDTGTGSANAAELDAGNIESAIGVSVDTTGSATLTVEWSDDGATWSYFDKKEYTNATEEVEIYPDYPFRHVRAYLDQNRTDVTVSTKGL